MRVDDARADLAERLERGADALSQRAPALSLTALEQLLREAAEALRSPDSGDGACSDPTCSYRAERDDGGAFGREEVQHALLAAAGDPQEAWSILTGNERLGAQPSESGQATQVRERHERACAEVGAYGDGWAAGHEQGYADGVADAERGEVRTDYARVLAYDSLETDEERHEYVCLILDRVAELEAALREPAPTAPFTDEDRVRLTEDFIEQTWWGEYEEIGKDLQPRMARALSYITYLEGALEAARVDPGDVASLRDYASGIDCLTDDELCAALTRVLAALPTSKED